MTSEEFQKLVLEELSNIKGQLSETNQIVKALMHRAEELDAKYDSLLHNTATKDAIANLATKDDIERIETKIEILSHRILAQDGEIQLLKKAK